MLDSWSWVPIHTMPPADYPPSLPFFLLTNFPLSLPFFHYTIFPFSTPFVLLTTLSSCAQTQGVGNIFKIVLTLTSASRFSTFSRNKSRSKVVFSNNCFCSLSSRFNLLHSSVTCMKIKQTMSVRCFVHMHTVSRHMNTTRS